MKVLFVSYPMLPVSDASCGGAEQMLWTLEREMARRGHQTYVAACRGSSVAGTLIPTGDAPAHVDAFEQRAAEHSALTLKAVREEGFDLVHDKSGFFWRKAGEFRTPLLATLHLPRSFYNDRLFHGLATNVRFNCVSASQAGSFRDLRGFLGVVPNGIAVERFRFEQGKGNFVLWLGRICPEKAPHLAIDAAAKVGINLELAGQVYPFSWHQLYFDQEIRPRLERFGAQVRCITSPSFREKVDLMSKAKALLLPTLAPETSSLVTMEAMACGTPVIAFPNGALPEIIEDGVTGFLVHDVEEMADAIPRAGFLTPIIARDQAEQRFSSLSMADAYEALYRKLTSENNRSTQIAA